MRIDLPPKLEELVRSKIESGEYKDESDVVCEALRRMAAADKELAATRERLRQALIAGEQSGFIEDFSMERFLADIEDEERRELAVNG